MFDTHKAKAALFYVLEKTKDMKNFGKTKLWKTLWEADVNAVGKMGESITRLTHYTKWERGPVPLPVSGILQELVNCGDVLFRSILHYNHELHKYLPATPFNRNLLSVGERKMLDRAIEKISPMTAKKAPQYSHDHIWEMMEPGGQLPLSVSNFIEFFEKHLTTIRVLFRY